jgi:hypothetical protein
MFKKLNKYIFLIFTVSVFYAYFVGAIFAETNLPAKPDGDPTVESKENSAKKKEAEVKISGLLREDAYYIKMPESLKLKRTDLFANQLETRLILDRTRDDWSFYADGRLYLYGGEFQKAYGLNRLSLMRAYARDFSPIGDFTVGKTYVNFGNSGLFNPFEIDKKIQLTDIQYAREGLYAVEYNLPWQDLSSLKVYTGFNDAFNYNPMWGVSPGYHLGKFDLGGVFNHSDIDKNIAGIYFKGDAVVGVQGSWAAHLDDKLQYLYTELSGGVDYSFFEGKVVATALFYYNENGADEVKKYNSSGDSFLLAKYYGFLSLAWIIDEFWNVRANVFINLVDNSAVIMPIVSFIIANGLTLSTQLNFVTAKTDAEFSREKSGDVSVLIRLEGKF